jgi:glycosyltransferase involved in cell wall biosynthesis
VKKVLIITYYWPPSGGGGVQRWLKFVKYIRDFGWEPVIYTPDNPDFELQDETLSEDVPDGITVLKKPIWEPFAAYRMLLGKKAVQKQGVVAGAKGSLFSSLSIWIRGNYFIPDSRIFWVRSSVNYLTKYLRKNKIEALVTTGPPHSLHLIGLELKNRLGVKWLADFRDPWSKWDVLDQLKLSKRSLKSHQKLEHSVLAGADQIITVSPSLKSSLKELGAIKVEVITNGYDFEAKEKKRELPEKFRISHIGLLNLGRNPQILWEVLNELVDELPEFANKLEIFLSGTVEDGVVESIKSQQNLQESYINAGYLTHKQVIDAYDTSAVLLLLVNNTSNASWILPGKMFEYLAENKPILSLGKSNSDASDVLKDAGYNPCIEYDDKKAIKSFILSAYKDFKDGKVRETSGNTKKYHRRELTKSLAACLDQL